MIRRLGHRRRIAVAVASAAALITVGVAVAAPFTGGHPNARPAGALPVAPSASSAASTSAAPRSASPSRSAAPRPLTRRADRTAGAVPAKLVIGMGEEADRAAQAALTRQAPVRMLTSWYNRPSDFPQFMDRWKDELVPDLYAAGYALHVVQWAPEGESDIDTAHGPACGRPYPLSGRFLDDMKHLAEIFAGPADGPPFYVTLFTEFSTYPCVDNEWDSATSYYLALKDRYRAAYDVLHANAANVQVSLGFGGWLAGYDYPQKGGGRSLLNRFTDMMQASDFQSFQSMDNEPGENPQAIRDMTRILRPHGPVMLAHYKPDNGSQKTFDSDVRTIFTDTFIDSIVADGLFAMSFMTTEHVDANPATFAFLKGAVTRYGRPPA